MRTTLDIEIDVLDAARASAVRIPLSFRNGFPMFQVPAGTPEFGPAEVTAAPRREERGVAREFLAPGW